MALTRLSNQSLTSLTALPAAITTGKVINYYSNVNTSQSTVSNSTTTVVTSPNITPASTSSKFIITATINHGSENPNGAIFMYRELSGYNDLSPVQSISGNFGTTGNVKDLDEESAVTTYSMATWSQTFVDSPNTTSQLNYTCRISAGSGCTVYINRAQASANYKAVSTISILELSS
jgi:hypothetical protein